MPTIQNEMSSKIYLAIQATLIKSRITGKIYFLINYFLM